MEIRFLTAEDAGEWSRLRLEALKSEPEAFGASAEEHPSIPPEEIRRRVDSSTTDSFVASAFEGGHMVGMAGFVRERGLKSRHKGRIWGVYVAPEQRRRGLARQLFARILERAGKIEGLEQILISVATTQIAATRLYQSLGFETFGTEPRALKVEGRYIDEDHRILRLRRPG